WRLGVWHEAHRPRERRSRAAFAVTRAGRSARHRVRPWRANQHAYAWTGAILFARRPVSDLRMQRILVVDDDPSITSLLKRGLSYEGFAVDAASSGSEGLAIARERPPNLVILDVMMPGLDGLQVLEPLRAADAQLPVILLTARDAPADQIKGVGADDY